MYTPQSTDHLDMFWRGARQKAASGTHHVSGLSATVGSNAAQIEIEYTSGEVSVDGQTVSVPADTVVLTDGPAHPNHRIDAIYADANGALQTASGVPDEPMPTTDGVAYSNGGTPYPFRQLWNPAEPDVSSLAGVPLHTVLIPDGASASSDLGSADIRDYRIAASEPGPHEHPTLAYQRRVERIQVASSQYHKLATINDGTAGPANVRVMVYAANDETNAAPRALDVEIATHNGTDGVRANAYGARSGAGDVVVSEVAAATAGTTYSTYHLYYRSSTSANAYLIMEAIGDSFGGYSRTDALGANDVLGTVIHDTGDAATGGEAVVPKPPSVVRSDVEGTTDVAALASGTTTADNVPVSQGDGTVLWEKKVPDTGEQVAGSSYRFGSSNYSETSTAFTVANTPGEAIRVHNGQLKNTTDDQIAVTLTAQILNDTTGETTTARALQGGTAITGTTIDNSGTQNVTSGFAAVDWNATGLFDLEIKVTAGSGKVNGAILNFYRRSV